MLFTLNTLAVLLTIAITCSSNSIQTPPFHTATNNTVDILHAIAGKENTPIFRLPWSFDLPAMLADYQAATALIVESDHHSTPLLSDSQVIKINGFLLPYQTPVTKEGFLKNSCPYFYSIYKYFSERTDVIAMRLLKRKSLTAYSLHSDDDLDALGGDIKRFQIPILNADLSGLLLTLPHHSMLPVVAARGENYVETNPLFEMLYHYPRENLHLVPQWYGKNYIDQLLKLTRHVTNFAEVGAVYRLTTGQMHHFDTRTKHTVVNLSKKDRVTLAIDVRVNDWFKQSGNAPADIFGDMASWLEIEENRKKNVMLTAAKQYHDRMGKMGKIVIDTPVSGSTIFETVSIDMSISFVSEEEYEAYKTVCGRTVDAGEKQLMIGNCRVELFFDDKVVAEKDKIETVTLDLQLIQSGEYYIYTQVRDQNSKVLMRSEKVSIVVQQQR